MLRHQISPIGVATPKPCCDTNFPNWCRDTKFLPIVSRHQNCVTTLLKPFSVATQSIPASPSLGRDLKTMSRPGASFILFNLCCVLGLSRQAQAAQPLHLCSDLKSMSQHTSQPTHVVTSNRCRDPRLAQLFPYHVATPLPML